MTPDTDALVALLREKVNASPILQSLLYDLNLLPEQIGKDLKKWAYVESIVEHIEKAALTAAPQKPQDDGWVKCSERLPTQQDADENGKVIYACKHLGAQNMTRYVVNWWTVLGESPHGIWRPLPPLPKE